MGTQEFVIIRSFPAPEIESAWRNLLGRAELPSHYTAPEFFLEKHFANRRPFAMLSMHYGTANGVLTGMHGPHGVVSGLPGRSQISLDPLTDRRSAVHSLLTGLLEEARSCGLIEVFSDEPLDCMEEWGFQVQHFEGAVVLDLSQPLELLFKQLNHKRRNNIRFAIKHQLEFVEVTTESEFSSYYHDVYSHWRSTARKKVLGAETTFEGYAQRFELNANRKLFVARISGKTIAGAFVRFYPGGLVQYAANSSLDQYLRLKPNEFIQWKAIEWARNQGFKAYSLSGAGQFHREFGGTVVPAYRYWRDQTLLRRHKLKHNIMALYKDVLNALRRQSRASHKIL